MLLPPRDLCCRVPVLSTAAANPPPGRIFLIFLCAVLFPCSVWFLLEQSPPALFFFFFFLFSSSKRLKRNGFAPLALSLACLCQPSAGPAGGSRICSLFIFFDVSPFFFLGRVKTRAGGKKFFFPFSPSPLVFLSAGPTFRRQGAFSRNPRTLLFFPPLHLWLLFLSL